MVINPADFKGEQVLVDFANYVFGKFHEESKSLYDPSFRNSRPSALGQPTFNKNEFLKFVTERWWNWKRRYE